LNGTKRLDRRLCAGDWVTPVGHERTVRGIGKIVDADYEDEDDALVQAFVGFARGSYWFAAGDLLRIEAEDEARLCEAALASAVLPAAQADRLRSAVGAFRAGRTTFVRTPGLLDLLWSFLPDDHRPEVCGLARLFEAEANATLPARPASADARHLPAPLFASPEALLPKILRALTRRKLLQLAEAAGVPLRPGAPNVSNEQLKALLIAAGVDGAGVVVTLDSRQLRAAYNSVARPKARAQDTDEVLRARLLAAFESGTEAQA